MSWLYNPSSWVDGVTIPTVTDYQNIAADIHRQGGNADGAGYGRSNAGFVTLKAGELPGAIYGVTAASWANGIVTLTIGAHDIAAGQHVAVSGVTPAAYNIGDAPITGIGANTISYAMTNNPGVWTSGGAVTVGTSPPAAGMLAASPAFPASLYFYDGTKWVALGAGVGGQSAGTQIGNINASGYGLYNQSFTGFRPGELPGTQYNVQAASWAGNVATLTIGTNNLQVGQHISLTGANPVGWNVPDTQVTSVTGNTIQFNMSNNPGAWTSGGTVGVDLLSAPSMGMLAVDSTGRLQYYNGSSWSQPGAGLIDPTTARGDLIARGALGPPKALPIGATDGLALMVDSTQPLNMKWSAINTTSLGAVPTSTRIVAGPGLTGGGALTGNVQLNAAVVSVFGRTGAVILTNSDITGAGGVSNSTQIVAGPGLTGGGQLTGNVQLNANVISVFGRTGAVTMTPTDIVNAGGVPATRKINTGYGLSGGGDLSGDLNLSAVDDATVQKTGWLYQGSNVSARSYLNFSQSGNITVTVADNPTNNRVDVNIGTASAASTTVSHKGVMVGTESILNLIDGSNVALTVADNPGFNRIDVTISSTGGGTGGGGSQTPWLTTIDAASNVLINLTSINGPTSSINKLGIGTDTPTGVLDVAHSNPGARTNITFSNPGAESVANRVRLRMGPSASFTGTDLQPYMEAMNLNVTGSSGLGFGSFDSGNLYENMRLVPWANGQVYIGTTTPLSAGGLVANGNERLHVSGQAIIGNTPVSSAVLPGSQPLLALSDANNPTAYLSIQQLSSSGSHSAAIQFWANTVGWRLSHMGNLDASTAPLMNRLAVMAPGATEVFSIYTTGLVLASSLQLSSSLKFTAGGITFPDSSFQGTAFPGVAGSQTPWVSDIDAASHMLFNAKHVAVGNDGTVLPDADSPASHLVVGATASGSAIGEVTVCGNNTTPGAVMGLYNFANYALAGPDKRVAAIMGETDTASNTGMLQFLTWDSVGAHERMRIKNTGIGIGTTAPLRSLHVGSVPIGGGVAITGSAPCLAISNADTEPNTNPMAFVIGLATAAGNYQVSSGDAVLATQGSARGNIYINSNYSGAGAARNVYIQPAGGGVGIGTTALGGALTVSAAADHVLNVRGDPATFGYPTTLLGPIIQGVNSAQNAYAPITFVSPINFMFPGGGAMGVGTTAPLSLVHLHVAANQNIQIGSMGWLLAGSVGFNAANDANNGGLPMCYAAALHAFSGAVGIGTTAPASALDVNGNVTIRGTCTIGAPAKAVAGSAGYSFTSVGDGGAPLQAWVQMYTDPTAANRRLALGIVDQGVAWRNITLCETAGNVGIGLVSPLATLSLSPTLGDKLAVYDAGAGNMFGFGIQSSQLQIYTPNAACRASIGYGNSASFTETLQVIGSSVGVGLAGQAPYGPFTVCPPSNYVTAATAKQITIGESSHNPAYCLALGYFYDSTLSFCGSIQAIIGNAAAPLLLNPSGGSIGIGIPGGLVRSVLSIIAATPSTIATATQLTICEGTNNAGYGLAIGYGTNPSSGWAGVLQVTAGGGGYPLLLNPAGGAVGIGKAAPAFNLDVQGSVNCTAGYYVNGAALPTGGGVTTQTKPARAIGGIYQNTTGKAMFVSVSFNAFNQILLIAYSDASASPATIVAWAGSGNSTQVQLSWNLSFWVLPGNYYQANWQVGPGGGGTLGTWTEWY